VKLHKPDKARARVHAPDRLRNWQGWLSSAPSTGLPLVVVRGLRTKAFSERLLQRRRSTMLLSKSRKASSTSSWMVSMRSLANRSSACQVAKSNSIRRRTVPGLRSDITSCLHASWPLRSQGCDRRAVASCGVRGTHWLGFQCAGDVGYYSARPVWPESRRLTATWGAASGRLDIGLGNANAVVA
jgi:hypothetical protein